MTDFLNSVQLSGKIIGDPQLRRPDNRKLAVLSFTAETLEAVGRSGRQETVKWRAKIFGSLAEKAVKDLGRGIHVVVVGRVSGYEGVSDASGKKKSRHGDVDVVLDVHRYVVLANPTIVSKVVMEDNSEESHLELPAVQL